MAWFLLAVSMPIKIDAQNNPIPPLAIFAASCAILWLLTSQARKRDVRRARGRDLTAWRSRQPPRY
jgi:hypothetical protein